MPHVTPKLLRFAALCTIILVAACRDDQPGQQEYVPAVTWDSATAQVVGASDTYRITVEVAERDDQRAYGLMERTALPENHGMIFLHHSEQPADAGFWMYRTRIPLDIAYFDQDGVIVAIRGMEPCPHADPRGCPSYPPGMSYHGALEMNRNWFASRGVGIGDRIIVER